MKKKNLIVKILIGVPASGKSTWSTDFVMKNPNYVRVNRDDYRFMLTGQPVCEPKVEDAITEMMFNAIDSALTRKLNVIVDNTNLKRKYIDAIVEHVKYRADVEFQVFDISLEKAIERDAAREKKVGEKVLEKMYKDYKDLMDGFSYSNMRMETFIYQNPTFNEELPNAVIFDLDGTLAHSNGKRGYFDWEIVDRDDLDTIVWGTYDLYRRGEGDYRILIVTGRDEKAREASERWLEYHGIEHDGLFMRTADDFRKDNVVKKEIYEQHIKDRYNVHIVFDDRQKVVDMWRSIGLKVFQVNKAD
jgi:predicted kinase